MTELSSDDPRSAWAALDPAWQTAFELAWEAVRSGNIGVGAVATSPDGTIIAVGRNRVAETSAPLGQVAGTSLAHAEINVLAQLPFRSPKTVVLTTTLEPCLQCSAAIRMGPIGQVRFAGCDPIWEGSHDFGSLGPWLARREPVHREGPRPDLLGAFGVLLARFGPGLVPHVESALRECGEGPLIDLALRLERDKGLSALLAFEVGDLLARLWDDLAAVSEEMVRSSTWGP